MEARLNINMVSGGIKANIVPDQCLISIDRRLIPEENIEEAKKELLAVLSSVPDVRWRVESLFSIPSIPPREDPIVDELAAIIEDVTGQDGKFGDLGSGDLSHVAAGWGGKTFNLGVIRPQSNIHGKDEFVIQKDAEDLGEIIRRFLTS